MATIANFGGEIKQFEMDVDKSSSLAERWLIFAVLAVQETRK